MNVNRYLAISIVIAGFALGGAVLVLPLGSQSKAPSKSTSGSYVDRLQTLQKQVSEELAKGNFALAESDAKSYLVLAKNSDFGYMRLGDVYLTEHKNPEAWTAYRKAIMPNLPQFRDADRLLAFGQAAEATNHPKDAFDAYRQVADLAGPIVGPEVLTRIDNGRATVAEARNAARAIYLGTTHQPGYVKAIQDAVKEAPGEPACHYMYAWLLVPYGHIKDAKEQVDLAAALLPKEAAKVLIARTDEQFGFKAWGHGSKGVVGKDGNVTITYFPTPLKNSNIPIVEDTRATVTPSPDKP